MVDEFDLQASLMPELDQQFTPTNPQSPSYPPSHSHSHSHSHSQSHSHSHSHLRPHHHSTVHSFYESSSPEQSGTSAPVFPQTQQHQVLAPPARQTAKPFVSTHPSTQPAETSTGIPPLFIPESYSIKTRHLALLPSLVASSGNDSNNISSDRIFTDVRANQGVPCPLDDSDVPGSPGSPLRIPAEVPVPKEHPPLSELTGEYPAGMYAAPGTHRAPPKGSSPGRDPGANLPYRSMSWPPPTAAPVPVPVSAPAPAPAQALARSSAPTPSHAFCATGSDCSLISKEMVTPTSSPPTLRVVESPPIRKALTGRRPRTRRRRELKVIKPEDMDLDVVQAEVEKQRDPWLADIERQFGKPADAEVKAAYDRVLQRAKRLTEIEKVNQRERKRPDSQKPPEASRLEASLSRYVKEVLIQCLFVEVEALVRDRCVVQRALKQRLGQNGVEGSGSGTENDNNDDNDNGGQSEGRRKKGCACACVCGRGDGA